MKKFIKYKWPDEVIPVSYTHLYEHGEYTQFIQYMYDHQLISDRTYKKLIKKVK